MPSKPSRHLRSVDLLLAAVLATSVLAGCSRDSAESPSEHPVAERGAGAEFEHIHGLGINPADGRLLIATHHGLFGAAEGQATPVKVGTSGQDIMGFSVVGPDHFIGSGHPGVDQDLPPNLGLIESHDGGRTWRNVSLLGEADFHLLEHSDEKIYGFDSTQGRLMVSSDRGRTWAEHTPPAGAFGMAVDPTNASHVVTSTEQGIYASTNEGRTWKPLRHDIGGLLAWPSRDRLYLLDGQGQVLLSADGGASWQARGSVGGQPAAFIAYEDELYAALADGTIKRSADGGATWSSRTS